MIMAIRIGVLSIAMALYMTWAFRGIENNPLEAGPAVLEYFISFMICAVIAVPVYRMIRKPDGDALSAFAFRVWLVTATLVAIGWLIYFSQNLASQGEFTNNMIVGAVIMAAMVAVLNYLLILASRSLMQKRR